jgi:glycosyltransferase involved in cell wall biosynthesis
MPAVIRSSVCMATLNGARFLRPQIESILVQLGPSDELIVSDDGSSDGTLEVLGAYRDSRLRVYQNHFRDVASNFAFAIGQARGRTVFLSDQDDEWHPRKLEILQATLERFDLVVSDCEVIGADGRSLAPSYFELNRSRPGIVANLWRNSYLGCCMAFQMHVIGWAQPFPPRVPHDLWLGLVAELRGTTRFLGDKLVRFRRHEHSASYAAGESRRTLLEKIGTRVRAATFLMSRQARIARK